MRYSTQLVNCSVIMKTLIIKDSVFWVWYWYSIQFCEIYYFIMVLEESTNITGWLLKKTNSMITWYVINSWFSYRRKRFFILQNNRLVYYRSLRDNVNSCFFLYFIETKSNFWIKEWFCCCWLWCYRWLSPVFFVHW